ncbi:MAG: hypothetical protein KDC27_07130, partial [Acidobacteria bacterium]|nr:hypothetical protein [Acidobacteriota bacterium]
MNNDQDLHPEAQLMVHRYLINWLIGVSSLLSLLFGVGGVLFLNSIKDSSDARAEAAALRAVDRFDAIYAKQQEVLAEMRESRAQTEELRENLQLAEPELQRAREVAKDL